MRQIKVILFVLAAALLGAGLAQAQVKHGKTRPLKTGQLMKGVVKSSCDAVKKGLENAAPTDDDWAALAMHAALLNETSHTLMDDGRCPDDVWSNAASKTMRGGSGDLVKAAEAKDIAAAKQAFGAMMKSCKECHEKHKEKK